MLFGHQQRQLFAIGGYAPTLADAAQQIHAAHLVPNMARQDVRRRCAFAQIVGQGGKAHRQRRLQAHGHLQHHHGMHARVDFGVVFGALRHTPQCVQFRHQHRQRTAVAQHGEHAFGLGAHQPFGHFLPNAFGHQGINFPCGDHVLHQLLGGRRHAKAGKTRCKSCQTQDAHRVFGKSGGDMAQHARLQISQAAVWV